MVTTIINTEMVVIILPHTLKAASRKSFLDALWTEIARFDSNTHTGILSPDEKKSKTMWRVDKRDLGKCKMFQSDKRHCYR